jgi:hypothetical protein
MLPHVTGAETDWQGVPLGMLGSTGSSCIQQHLCVATQETISNGCKFSFHVIQERLEDIELHTCKTLVAVWTLFSSRSSTWYGCLDGLAGVFLLAQAAVCVHIASSSLGRTEVIIETIKGGATLDWISWWTRTLSIVIVYAFLRRNCTTLIRCVPSA